MKIVLQSRRPDDTIDMTVDGSFVDPPASPIAARIFRIAIVVALAAGALALAGLMIWFALMLIPVMLAAGFVAWAAWRWQLWRATRRAR